MQNDSKAGTVVVLPTTKANRSVKEVTVMETPELVKVLEILLGSSLRSVKVAYSKKVLHFRSNLQKRCKITLH